MRTRKEQRRIERELAIFKKSTGPRKRLYMLCRRDEKGNVQYMINQSFTMDWSSTHAYAWDCPPIHYFKPQEGHFIMRLHSKKHCPSNLNLRCQRGPKGNLILGTANVNELQSKSL